MAVKNKFENFDMKRSLASKIKKYSSKINEIGSEINKFILGQEKVVEDVLTCLVADGHALLEGVPGIAKTYLIKTLSDTISNVKFERIQFTPDLLPSDIVGLVVYNPQKGFYTQKGPIFANFILSDEINRAPPKVQSAMLECMQERVVTIGKETFQLPKPFLVLATQNPLEQMGTYPLPEAQIDRFLYKIYVGYPSKEDEIKIIDNNMDTTRYKKKTARKIATPEEIIDIQKTARQIYISDEIKKYIVDIVFMTREKKGLKHGKYIEWGASPRASIALSRAAKAYALIKNRSFVTPDDIKRVVFPILRHRIILNYEGKALGITTDQIIKEIIEKVPVP